MIRDTIEWAKYAGNVFMYHQKKKRPARLDLQAVLLSKKGYLAITTFC